MSLEEHVSAEKVLEIAREHNGTDDPTTLLPVLAKELALTLSAQRAYIQEGIELEGLYDTVIGCLVAQLGGEARISRASLENPPPLDKDDDPVSGDWIYRTGEAS